MAVPSHNQKANNYISTQVMCNITIDLEHESINNDNGVMAAVVMAGAAASHNQKARINTFLHKLCAT